MNSNKKSTPVRGMPPPFSRQTRSVRQFNSGVTQLKTAVSAQSTKRPVAPPVYRPQPLPKVLQTKRSLSHVPKVLQTKPVAQRQHEPKSLAKPGSPPGAIQRWRGGTQATIQREITPSGPGPRGKELEGRYVRSQHGEMGIIMEYHSKTDAYEIQTDDKRPEDNFYVVGSDPYWRVVSENSETYLYKHARRTRPKHMMSLKTYDLQKNDEIEYEVRNGVMFDKAGQKLNPMGYDSKPNVVSFVITQNMELRIGRGHTGLSKGHTVIMAGIMKIVDGVATYAGNESGHYFPEGLEEVRGIKYMLRHFPWINIPKSSVGKWLPEALKGVEDNARSWMVKILTSDDKEERRTIKRRWEESLRKRQGIVHTPLM